MEQLIASYIESKKLAWSQSTLSSETYRLRAADFGQLADPAAQYTHLVAKLKPYALKTMFVRLTDFYDWYKPGEVNPYRQFMKKNARLFKHVYKEERLEITYEEAKKRITSLSNPTIRSKALFDLQNGLRVKADRIEDGQIRGKGNKLRPLVADVDQASRAEVCYTVYREALKEIGLKPHSLRKLWATNLLNKGFTLKEIQELGGWESLASVQKYLQAGDLEDLKKRARRVA